MLNRIGFFDQNICFLKDVLALNPKIFCLLDLDPTIDNYHVNIEDSYIVIRTKVLIKSFKNWKLVFQILLLQCDFCHLVEDRIVYTYFGQFAICFWFSYSDLDTKLSNHTENFIALHKSLFRYGDKYPFVLWRNLNLSLTLLIIFKAIAFGDKFLSCSQSKYVNSEYCLIFISP